MHVVECNCQLFARDLATCVLHRISQFEMLKRWTFKFISVGSPDFTEFARNIDEIPYEFGEIHGPPQKCHIFQENRVFKLRSTAKYTHR